MSTREGNAIGRIGEDVAASYLSRLGWEVIERNWRCADGEIDIIAREGSTLVVVEVKARRGNGYGQPIEAITTEKYLRLRRLTHLWLKGQERWEPLIRIDAIGVLVDRERRCQVTHIRGIEG
jgi:putative endonuclease